MRFPTPPCRLAALAPLAPALCALGAGPARAAAATAPGAGADFSVVAAGLSALFALAGVIRAIRRDG